MCSRWWNMNHWKENWKAFCSKHHWYELCQDTPQRGCPERDCSCRNSRWAVDYGTKRPCSLAIEAKTGAQRPTHLGHNISQFLSTLASLIGCTRTRLTRPKPNMTKIQQWPSWTIPYPLTNRQNSVEDVPPKPVITRWQVTRGRDTQFDQQARQGGPNAVGAVRGFSAKKNTEEQSGGPSKSAKWYGQ